MPKSNLKWVRTPSRIVILGAMFLVTLTRPSYAYVDPGSASIVITAVLGGIAALGYTVRLYWQRFKGLFKRDRRNQTQATGE